MQITSQDKDNKVIHLIALSVWIALFVSELLFLVVVYFAHGELFNFDFSQPLFGEGQTLIIILAVLGIIVFLLSFSIKLKPFREAGEKQPAVNLVGLIVALSLCEAVCMFGLITVFAFHYQYFFLWFVLGITGTVLHFPRKTQ